MSNESKIKKQYLQYIDDLRCAKVETVKFKCPCCDFKIESVKNTTSKDWNTVATCPECENYFYKWNRNNGQGVLVTKRFIEWRFLEKI